MINWLIEEGDEKIMPWESLLKQSRPSQEMANAMNKAFLEPLKEHHLSFLKVSTLRIASLSLHVSKQPIYSLGFLNFVAGIMIAFFSSLSPASFISSFYLR